MPRHLILFRHAKSEWPAGVADYDRPLSARGRNDAPAMARWLAGEGYPPSLALVSTARRTQETWRLASAELGPVPRQDEASIYEAPTARLLDLVRATEPPVMTLLVLGHNPGMEDLASLLMRDDGGEAGTRLRTKFPTAGIAVLSLPVEDWQDAAPHTAALERFATPKTITEP